MVGIVLSSVFPNQHTSIINELQAVTHNLRRFCAVLLCHRLRLAQCTRTTKGSFILHFDVEASYDWHRP